MRIAIGASVLVVQLLAFTLGFGAEPSDLPELAAIFEADQAIRSPENRENIRKSGGLPLQQERDRRFAVFQMISENELQTANDYFHAGVVLYHTGSIRQFDEEHSARLGTESKILAFFLFRRAHDLGHNSALKMMFNAYNSYLKDCGEDWRMFGYKYEDGEEIWRPGASDADSELVKCGFDPRPYFAAFDSMPQPRE